MYPWSHFLFGLLIGEILVKAGLFGQIAAFTLAILAVLVDLDHYLYYGIKHKNWSLANAWNAGSIKHEKGERTFIHHWKGFIVMTAVSAIIYLFSKVAGIIIASAYYSHLALDFCSWNFVGIKGKEKIKGSKFLLDIPKYEIFWDVVFVAGILLLLVL